MNLNFNNKPYKSVFFTIILLVIIIAAAGCGSKTVNTGVSKDYYTVQFDSQSADTAASPSLKTVLPPADTIDALPTPPVKAGKNFYAWYTKANGEGTLFTPATKVLTSFTLYALWVDSGITFMANGGTGTMPVQTFTQGTNFNLSLNRFVNIGKAFKGWSMTSDGAVVFEDGDRTQLSVPAGVLYAIWTPNLVANGEFASGSTSWTSSTGWQDYSDTTGTLPAVNDGFAVLSGTTAKVSQIVTMPDLSNYTKIGMSCQFKGQLPENILKLGYTAYDATGAVISTRTDTYNGNVPSTLTPYSYSASLKYLTPAPAKMELFMEGSDGKGLAGNHGPMVTAIALILE
jgi:hypothetical protein